MNGRGLAMLRDLRRDRWEAICSGCGQCCYEKDRHRGRVVTNWRAPCRYLELSTRRCSVYEKRFRVCAQCRRMTIFHALFTPWLPPTCGYVRRFRPWAGSPAEG
jgi:uncharacterized protein